MLTHCWELVVGDPSYVGYCNAFKLDTGGVWLAGTALACVLLPVFFWRVE